MSMAWMTRGVERVDAFDDDEVAVQDEFPERLASVSVEAPDGDVCPAPRAEVVEIPREQVEVRVLGKVSLEFRNGGVVWQVGVGRQEARAEGIDDHSGERGLA